MSGNVRAPIAVRVDSKWRDDRRRLEARKEAPGTRVASAFGARPMIRGALAISGMAARGRRNARALAVNVVRHRLSCRIDSPFTTRILQLSDPHFPETRDKVYEQTLIEAVAATEHDILVLTGDYRDESHGPWKGAFAALENVVRASDAPTIAVLGNHDPSAIVQPLSEIGIETLVNRHVDVRANLSGASIVIAGVDDPAFYRLHDLAAALDGVSVGFPTILLAHSPSIADSVPLEHVQLCLCGHTHGGQINAPGGVPLVALRGISRDTLSGHWHRGSMNGFTSRGVGTSVADARFFCSPELVLHEARFVPRDAL